MSFGTPPAAQEQDEDLLQEEIIRVSGLGTCSEPQTVYLVLSLPVSRPT